MNNSSSVTAMSMSINGVLAMFGLLTFNEWMTGISTACGVGTMLIVWHYRRKDDKRKEEEHRRERGE